MPGHRAGTVARWIRPSASGASSARRNPTSGSTKPRSASRPAARPRRGRASMSTSGAPASTRSRPRARNRRSTAVRTLLFVTEGFRGNADDYGDPRNSFLDAVIERRCGIPITLSVLLIEVARRHGIEVLGIGMPGHFLVREAADADRWYDPFHGGARLELLDCARLFAALHGGDPSARRRPTSRRPRRGPSWPACSPTSSKAGSAPIPATSRRCARCTSRSRRPCAAAGATAARVGARRRSGTRRARLRGSRGGGARRHRRRAADRGSPAAVAVELTCGADVAGRVLPMFPLGTVLFPHAVLPLHVFEPRYRVMMRRCIDGDGEFGVVLIERGNEVGGGDTRFDIGTVARIVQAAELEDGRFAIAAVGLGRFQVVRWLAEDPYPERGGRGARRRRAARRARTRRATACSPRSGTCSSSGTSSTTASRRRCRHRRATRPAISSRSPRPRPSVRSTRSACSKPTPESRARAARAAARRSRRRAARPHRLRVTGDRFE